VDEALSQGKIRDEIVDKHSLLLFIEFSANRCRHDRRREYIPNTRIGAVRGVGNLIMSDLALFSPRSRRSFLERYISEKYRMPKTLP